MTDNPNHERLRRIAYSALDAIVANPEVDTEQTKAIVIVIDPSGNELASVGFETGREVMDRLLSAARFVGEQSGVHMAIHPSRPAQN